MTNIVKPEALTPAARAALVGCGSHRQGTTVPQGTPAAVIKELTIAGLIGTCDGLTRAGTIVRAKIIDDALAAWG
jgi:hypothetical protein